jgi:hypothetical protein
VRHSEQKVLAKPRFDTRRSWALFVPTNGMRGKPYSGFTDVAELARVAAGGENGQLRKL